MMLHPSPRRRSLIFAATVFAGFIAFPIGAVAQERSAITYVLDDFEKARPEGHGGRTEAKVKFSIDTTHFHDGKQGVCFEWDLTQSSQPKQNFAHYDFVRRLAGKPESVAFWVFATEAEVGTRLRLVLADAGKEIYICNQPIAAVGWQKVVFPVKSAKIPSRSGDGNRVMDYPISTVGLQVENGKKGALTIDEASVVTRGAPRDLLVTQLIPGLPNGIGWGKSPTFTLEMTNPSEETLYNLSVDFSAKDALSGAEVWKNRASVAEVSRKEILAVAPELPNGVYDLSWVARDAAGELPVGSGTLRIARMAGDVSNAAHGPAERDYMFRYGPIGYSTAG